MSNPSRPPLASWLLLAIVVAVAGLSAAFVLITPAAGQTDLSGRSWAEFAATDPEVAALFEMQLGLIGLSALAFGALLLVVTLLPFRRGEPWAWWAMWLAPLGYGAIAGRMLVDGYGVGWYYLGIAAAATVGLLLALPLARAVSRAGAEPGWT